MWPHRYVHWFAADTGFDPTPEEQVPVPWLPLQSHCLASVASLTPGFGSSHAGDVVLRPSFLLALMFGVLALAERQFSRAEWTIAHVQPSSDGLTAPGRPVYTMQQPSLNKMCWMR